MVAVHFHIKHLFWEVYRIAAHAFITTWNSWILAYLSNHSYIGYNSMECNKNSLGNINSEMNVADSEELVVDVRSNEVTSL